MIGSPSMFPVSPLKFDFEDHCLHKLTKTHLLYPESEVDFKHRAEFNFIATSFLGQNIFLHDETFKQVINNSNRSLRQNAFYAL